MELVRYRELPCGQLVREIFLQGPSVMSGGLLPPESARSLSPPGLGAEPHEQVSACPGGVLVIQLHWSSFRRWARHDLSSRLERIQPLIEALKKRA